MNSAKRIYTPLFVFWFFLGSLAKVLIASIMLALGTMAVFLA